MTEKKYVYVYAYTCLYTICTSILQQWQQYFWDFNCESKETYENFYALFIKSLHRIFIKSKCSNKFLPLISFYEMPTNILSIQFYLCKEKLLFNQFLCACSAFSVERPHRFRALLFYSMRERAFFSHDIRYTVCASLYVCIPRTASNTHTDWNMQ